MDDASASSVGVSCKVKNAARREQRRTQHEREATDKVVVDVNMDTSALVANDSASAPSPRRKVSSARGATEYFWPDDWLGVPNGWTQ